MCDSATVQTRESFKVKTNYSLSKLPNKPFFSQPTSHMAGGPVLSMWVPRDPHQSSQTTIGAPLPWMRWVEIKMVGSFERKLLVFTLNSLVCIVAELHIFLIFWTISGPFSGLFSTQNLSNSSTEFLICWP